MTTITSKTCAWWAGSATSTGEKSRYYVRIVPIMIRRLAASWMGLGASHPFGWSAAPAAGPQAVGHPPCRGGVWWGPCPPTT